MIRADRRARLAGLETETHRPPSMSIA